MIPKQTSSCLMSGCLVAGIVEGKDRFDAVLRERRKRKRPSGSAIDLLLVLVCFRDWLSRTVLRRDIHHMSVIIALGRHVGRSLLEGGQPCLDSLPLAISSHLKAFPVQARGDHPFDVRDILQINDGGAVSSQKPRARRAPQSLVYQIESILERRSSESTWLEHESTPVAEQPPLKLHERVGPVHELLVRSRQHRLLLGQRVQHLHDVDTLTDHLPVDLNHRQEPPRVLCKEPIRLVTVGAHVNELDLVRYLLLLKQQPNFLTVRAPCCAVSIQHNSNVFLLLSEQSELVLAMGWPSSSHPLLLLLHQPRSGC
mmetsp:Transcript_15334/g.35162  ORF Transcript_15334/g.35162 Transcript_15334/m.35162 type:complete len:313 (-) Transcript_15334:374-1312(-)